MVHRTPAAIAAIVFGSLLLVISAIATILMLLILVATIASGNAVFIIGAIIGLLPIALFVVAAIMGIVAGAKVINKCLWIASAVLSCLCALILVIGVINAAAKGQLKPSFLGGCISTLVPGIGLAVSCIIGAVQCDRVKEQNSGAQGNIAL